MGDILGSRNDFWKSALDAQQTWHKELAETWRSLEGKAQGTVAIAGIFLAAVFAFARDINRVTANDFDRVLVGLAVLSLVLSIGLAVLALWVREVASPDAAAVQRRVEDLDHLPDNELLQHAKGLLRAQLNMWSVASAQLSKANDDKAQRLHGAQAFLLSGAVLVTLLTLLSVFRSQR